MTAQNTPTRTVFLPLLVLVLTLSRDAGADAPTAVWSNALKPTGGSAAPLTIAAGTGTPLYAILLPTKATAPETNAAADLTAMVERTFRHHAANHFGG